eukprot:scaffold3307_cov265-Pinguiococcus_pyrenoidosus.AAC.11
MKRNGEKGKEREKEREKGKGKRRRTKEKDKERNATALPHSSPYAPHTPGGLAGGRLGSPHVALSEHHFTVQEGGPVVRQLFLAVETVLAGAGLCERGLPFLQRLRGLKLHAKRARLRIDGVRPASARRPDPVGSESAGEFRERRVLLANSMEDDELRLGHFNAGEDAGASAQVHKAVGRVPLVLCVEEPVALKCEEARLPAAAPAASPKRPSLQITVRGNSPVAASALLRVHHDLETLVPLREHRVAAAVLEAPVGRLWEAAQHSHGLARGRRQRRAAAVVAVVGAILSVPGTSANLRWRVGVLVRSRNSTNKFCSFLVHGTTSRTQRGLPTSQVRKLCRLGLSRSRVGNSSAAATAPPSS